jgi:hypothetical protein
VAHRSFYIDGARSCLTYTTREYIACPPPPKKKKNYSEKALVDLPAGMLSSPSFPGRTVLEVHRPADRAKEDRVTAGAQLEGGRGQVRLVAVEGSPCTGYMAQVSLATAQCCTNNNMCLSPD